MPIDVPTAKAKLSARLKSALSVAQIAVPGVDLIAGDRLDDAIGYGLHICKVPMADVTAPTSDDLLALKPADWFKFLDVAEFRLLTDVAAAMPGLYESIELPDVKRTRDVKAFGAYLQGKTDFVRRAYGVGVPTVGVGSIGRTQLPPYPNF